jgi:hypothetical protein
MSQVITTFADCPTNRSFLKHEISLRRNAQREQDLYRAVHLASAAIIVQKHRFLHEESCDICRRAEGLIQ